MSNHPSIKKNFILNTILSVSSFLFPLIVFPYVSRVLLPVGTGKVAMATSLISYFNIFAQLGIPTYGIRACAIVRDDREELSQTVQELLVINLCTTVTAYLLLLGSIYLVPDLRQEKALYLIIGLTIGLNMIGMEWMYKGLEMYSYITKRSIIFKLLALIFVFLFVHAKEHYVVYGAISIFASSASNVLNLLNSRKYITFKKQGPYHLAKHLTPIIVFFGMACATTIYTNLDNVMLGFMKTSDDVGCYHAAVRIRTVLLSIVTSLGAVMLPRCSYYVEHNMMDKFWAAGRKAIHFVMLLSAPITVYGMLYAENCIYFLAGEAYSASILPMQIIMPTLILVGITNILGFQILVPTGNEKIMLYSVITGSVTDLIINMLLIPRYSLIGAAIGTLAAELAVLIVQCVFLRKVVHDSIREIPFLRMAISIVISILMSYWTVFVVHNSFFVLLITGILFFLSYGLSLLVLKEPLACEYCRNCIALVRRHAKQNGAE